MLTRIVDEENVPVEIPAAPSWSERNKMDNSDGKNKVVPLFLPRGLDYSAARTTTRVEIV